MYDSASVVLRILRFTQKDNHTQLIKSDHVSGHEFVHVLTNSDFERVTNFLVDRLNKGS